MPKEKLVDLSNPVVNKVKDTGLIHELEERGYTVHKTSRPEPKINLEGPREGSFRFGSVSDTHLGNKYQQLTYLHRFYEEARDWGAEFILHGGDVLDGTNMHKDQQYELFKNGCKAQVNYAAEHYPVLRNRRNKVLKTYVIQGNHDRSFYNDSGADALEQLGGERSDISYLGALGAHFNYAGIRMYIMHPDGGVPYARSYRPQKIVEQIAPELKPHLLFIGHLHVGDFLPKYRNVDTFLLPCFQCQTPYLVRKGLQPVVGGVLIEVEYNKLGPISVTHKWRTFSQAIEDDWSWTLPKTKKPRL